MLLNNKKLFCKKRLSANKKGQAIVELALILPLLLFLIICMIDFGRVLNAYLVMNNASRDGVRQAAVGKSDAEISQSIYNTAASFDSSNMSISITPAIADRTRGTEVQVSLSYQIEIVTPLINKIISNPYTVNTSTSMRVE